MSLTGGPRAECSTPVAASRAEKRKRITSSNLLLLSWVIQSRILIASLWTRVQCLLVFKLAPHSLFYKAAFQLGGFSMFVCLGLLLSACFMTSHAFPHWTLWSSCQSAHFSGFLRSLRMTLWLLIPLSFQSSIIYQLAWGEFCQGYAVPWRWSEPLLLDS